MIRDRLPEITLLCGDAAEKLRTLPEASARCVVTSPPFFGLRDYGTAQWAGGKPECDHRVREFEPGDSRTSTLSGSRRNTNHALTGPREECELCGARREDHQIGLENSLGAYIERLVRVFAEVRRVMTDDGTLWIEMGDCYDAGTRTKRATNAQSDRHGYWADANVDCRVHARLGPKQLVGVPWRLALALQADGWILRSCNIWHKVNTMPESCRDRPTTAHTYVFLLAKQLRYFYNQQATLEPTSPNTHARVSQNVAAQAGSVRANGGTRATRPMKTVLRGGVNPKADGREKFVKQNSSFALATNALLPLRNRRTVWSIPTKGYKGDHYATFPPDLVRPLVLASSLPGDTVLDPFAGTCTVGEVAIELGRDFVGIDLSAKYLELGRKRLARADAPLIVLPKSSTKPRPAARRAG